MYSFHNRSFEGTLLSGGTRSDLPRPEEHQAIATLPRAVMDEMMRRFEEEKKKLHEKFETAPIASSSATPIHSHPITLPPLRQPNQYGNPYDVNYVPAKDRGPPGPTKALPQVPGLVQDKIASTIAALEAEESGEKVKDEKSFGRKLKRGKKVFHKHGDPTCECFNCITTTSAKPVDVKQKSELDNLVYAMLKGLNKRKFDVSRKYAEEFLAKHDNNLVHAMNAAVEDLKKREAAIQLSGRTDFTTELEVAGLMGIRHRDEILSNLENDDKQMLEFDERGWNSNYGKAIAKQPGSDKCTYYDVYKKEARYRKARAQLFAEKKDELDTGKLKLEEFKDAMTKFDNMHGYGKAHRIKIPHHPVNRGLGKPESFPAAAHGINEEEVIITQDTFVDSLMPASKAETDNADAKELPVKKERKDQSKIQDNTEKEKSDAQDTNVDSPVPASKVELDNADAKEPQVKKELKGKSKTEGNDEEERVDAQDANVHSPMLASKTELGNTDAKEPPVKKERKLKKKVKGEKKSGQKGHKSTESKVRELVKPKTEADMKEVAQLVAKNGHEELVYSLMQTRGDEAIRHQRFLLLHDEVAGSFYDGAEVGEYSINHLMEVCPLTETRERAILEIQIAMGSAALAVAFSQARECELDKMHIRKWGKEVAMKIDRPAYSQDEAMRFIMAVLYQILPKP